MQVFANGKPRFHFFIEFFVIHLKSRGKNLIIVALYSRSMGHEVPGFVAVLFECMGGVSEGKCGLTVAVCCAFTC